MTHTDKRRIPSPDGSFEAKLRADGRMEWSSMRARLSLAGLSLSDRMFGWRGVWSPCSRYFAIMEWRLKGSLALPEARLVLMQPGAARECVIDQVRSGFVEPLRLYGGAVRYIRVDMTRGEQTVQERAIGAVAFWTPVRDLWADVLCPDNRSSGLPVGKEMALQGPAVLTHAGEA